MAIGTVLVATTAFDVYEKYAVYAWTLAFAIVTLVLFPVNTLAHEVGHLFFGFLAGMKFASVRFGRLGFYRIGKKLKLRIIRRSEVAGSVEMYPRNTKNVKGKTIAYSLGGIVFNLIYGGFFLASIFFLPFHPALWFFQLFAPLNLLEALAAIFPVTLAAGRTDGGLVLALIKKEPSAVLTVYVMTAQGFVDRGGFSKIDRSLLFDTPVVREDDLSFLALLQLRWYYLISTGDTEGAVEQLLRLEELYDYLPTTAFPEVACDLVFAYSAILHEKGKAERYLADAAVAKGSWGYELALFAYEKEIGKETEPDLSEVSAVIDGEPNEGMKEVGKRFLALLGK